MTNRTSDLRFCPRLFELVSTRRTVGETGRVFEDTAALSTVNNLLALRKLMLAHRPARTLEVGLCFGGSALAIAATHQEYAAPARQHIAIDPYQRPSDFGMDWDLAGVKAIREAGLEAFVDVRYKRSAIVLPECLAAGDRFALIYIDGSHRFDDVYVDAYYAGRLLAIGGVMLFDDSTVPGVQKVLRYMRRNCAHWLQEISMAPYHPAGHTTKYRIGSMLNKLQLTGFRRTAEGPGNYFDPLVDF